MYELASPVASIPGRPLGTLRRGEKGIVVGLVDGLLADGLLDRLLEMGFVEGAPIEVIHEGPVGRDPVGVLLHDCCFALRRQEANAILVEG